MGRFLALVAVSLVFHGNSASAPNDQKVYKAKGADLTVSLVMEKGTILAGEPTYVSLVVHNRSAKPLHVVVGKDVVPEAANKARFVFSARRDDGVTVLPPPLPLHYNGPIDYMSGPNVIPAHGDYKFERFLPRELPITKPGKYSIRCQKQLEILIPAANGGWDEKQKPDYIDAEAAVDLTILPPNYRALGKVIDRLGTEMTESKPDEGGTYGSVEHAYVALSSIPDARAIPWFIKLLRMRNSTYKGEAVGSLARFNSPAAFAAVKSALKTKGEDLRDWNTPAQRRDAAEGVRLAVAFALAKSPRPETLSALFALKHDSNENIRLQVVHAAGTGTSRQTFAILAEMSRDPSKVVADEATRYLGLRKTKK